MLVEPVHDFHKHCHNVHSSSFKNKGSYSILRAGSSQLISYFRIWVSQSAIHLLISKWVSQPVTLSVSQLVTGQSTSQSNCQAASKSISQVVSVHVTSSAWGTLCGHSYGPYKEFMHMILWTYHLGINHTKCRGVDINLVGLLPEITHLQSNIDEDWLCARNQSWPFRKYLAQSWLKNAKCLVWS